MAIRTRLRNVIVLALSIALLFSSIAFAEESASGGFFSLSGKSKTQLAYRLAICMKDHKDKLQNIDGKIYYGTTDLIEIEPEYAEYCESSAIYCSLAEKVQDFIKNGKRNYKTYSDDLFDTLFGIRKPSTYKKAKPYFEKIKSLFVSNDGSEGIFNCLKNTNSVSGTFDFAKRYAEFEITNTSELAKELGVSEEALGYILAVFDDYLADVQFDGECCKVICNPFKNN